MNDQMSFYHRILSLIFILFSLSGCLSVNEVQHSALHYFKQGNQAFDKRDYQEAIADYKRAIQLDPSNPSFHYNLGMAYYYGEKYLESIQAFKTVIQQNPVFATAYYNIALAYYQLYDTAQADLYYGQYQAVLEKDPKQLSQDSGVDGLDALRKKPATSEKEEDLPGPGSRIDQQKDGLKGFRKSSNGKAPGGSLQKSSAPSRSNQESSPPAKNSGSKPPMKPAPGSQSKPAPKTGVTHSR